ncbi:MAG: GMC family oxidoreductase N-terminal domain-containing protein [Dongiaceae bacterium]
MADYIIVGGGSAGCVMAGRLSEMADAKVVLFEQGPRDWNPYIHIPVTYFKTAQGSLLSRYRIEPLQAGRQAAFPEMVQGRVLGGGSSVNGMVYMRGNPQDYDNWAAQGCHGWSYAEVLPYFRKAESNERFANEAHGTEGPLCVSDQRQTLPLTKAWLKACQDLGIPFNPDFNSGTQLGCGLYQVTMRGGLRSSAAVAYLRPARRRRNLEVVVNRMVTRILVEGGRAVGVEYREGGAVRTMRAEREVIVASGGIGSPHLLLRSGIGPADHLRAVGVPVAHDLPGVGENLHDHVDVFLIYDLTGPHSYDKYKKPHWQAAAALQYALFRNGPLTSNIAEGGLCWWGPDRSDPRPDLQYHLLGGAGIEAGTDTTPSGHGCTLNIGQMRPRSRGRMTLRSADPAVPPILDPRYISEPHDVACLTEGVRVGQEIMANRMLRGYVRAISRPGAPLNSRAECEAFVRETAQGALHPCGACKMGSDPLAVVDPQFRVHGLEGLRVVDSSTMPFIPSGNLNGPTIMMAERAADFVRGNR